MRRLFPFGAALALVACQPASPEVDVDAEARMLANACLAEIGQPILPDRVTESATIELTEAEQAAYADCLQRRS